MFRFFLKFFLTIFALVFFLIAFLSYYGIETSRFDSLIKEKANKVNTYAKLEFKKTKIHINPRELNLIVRLQNPKLLVKKNEIILSKIDLFLTLKILCELGLVFFLLKIVFQFIFLGGIFFLL